MTSYPFWNQNQLFHQSLREMDNNENSTDSAINCGKFKLNKPNSQICKSIYTEDESQCYRGNENEDSNKNDIYSFIENTKTLKEKICQKLERKKKPNHQKMKVVETTFRPRQIGGTNSSQNKTNYNINVKSRNGGTNQYSYKKQCKEGNRKTPIMTQIEQANAMWDEKGERNMTQLDFYERQEKTVRRKKQLEKKLQEWKKQKEVQGCTFQPKLTKYRPTRRE